jgi:hypothetical protein
MAAACFTKRKARFEYEWQSNIHIAMIAADIAQEGRIVQAVNQILSSLK